MNNMAGVRSRNYLPFESPWFFCVGPALLLFLIVLSLRSEFRVVMCGAAISSAFSRMTEETIVNFKKDSQSNDKMINISINEYPEPPVQKPCFKEAPSTEETEYLAKVRTEPRTNQQTIWVVKRLRDSYMIANKLLNYILFFTCTKYQSLIESST